MISIKLQHTAFGSAISCFTRSARYNQKLQMQPEPSASFAGTDSKRGKNVFKVTAKTASTCKGLHPENQLKKKRELPEIMERKDDVATREVEADLLKAFQIGCRLLLKMMLLRRRKYL